MCLTYGRPQLLEEAIHAFLRQDYQGPKELLVLNDYDGQTLVFDHPEVRVVNVPRRFRTLGEKRNAAAALCSHEFLFVWDDDDIYLPHRLSLSVRRFSFQKGFFKAHNAWMWQGGKLTENSESIFHGGSAWSRRLFDAVGGYPAVGAGEDLRFEQRLGQRFPGSTATCTLAPDELYYIYRWNNSGSYHLSAHGGLEAGPNSGHDEVARFVRREAARGKLQRGVVELRPRWRTYWVRLIATLLEEGAERRLRESTPVGKLRAVVEGTVQRGAAAFDALMQRAAGDLEL